MRRGQPNPDAPTACKIGLLQAKRLIAARRRPVIWADGKSRLKVVGGGRQVAKREKSDDMAERRAMFRRFVYLTLAIAGALLLLLASIAMFVV